MSCVTQALPLGLIVLLVASTPPTRACSQPRQIDVPGQLAITSIPEFARQADLQILTAGHRLRSIRTPAVRGRFEPRDGLQMLLKGTGLEIAAETGGVVILRAARANVAKPAAPVAVRRLSAPPASAAANADTRSVELDEVVVTTQRRSELAVDVPLSVVPLAGAQLDRAGVGNVKELTFLVPGVWIDQSSNYVQPAIRGVSANVTGPSTEAPIAIYLDGVIQPNQVLNHFEFADIERVEVAKGPQGTLFGRNATGGAISIYTRSPSFAPAGNFTLGYGNFNRVFANGFLTGPLVGESLAGSVSLYYERHAGYDFDRLRNRRTDGLDSKSFRAKLLWRPVDWASITLSGSYQKRNDSDTGSGIPLNGNTEARLDPSALIPTRPHSTSFDTDTFVHFNHYAATIRGEFELPKGRLTTIGAFSRANARISYDADRSNSQTFKTAYIYSQPESMFSQEISYSSDKIGRVKYLVGAYYYRDNNRFYPNRIALGSDPASDVWYNSSNPVVAAALFSEADIDLNDRLTFIGGARYSWERRENKGALRVGGAPSGPLLQGPKVSFRSWTPRLSIMYQVRSYANLYFTLSRGFKSGGVPNSAFLTPPTGLSDVGYKPEYITAYELGLKATPGRKFSLGFAGYYYDYRDLQVQVQIPNGLVNIQNAASARIYGLDLDGAWRINEELSVRSSVALLDARYRQFRNAVVLRPKVNASGIGPSGNENVVIDASGNAMRRAPRYTMSLSAEYAHANKLGKFQLTVATFFTGKVYFDNDERISQRPYGLLNAQLSWRIRSTEVELSVWGKNLTDATYISSSFSQPVADVVGYGPRRTFGVNLVYEF